jgi:hypothetical protein
MNIHHLIGQAAFDPDATEAMGLAFEVVCKVKPKASRELIANRIIQLAKAGERDSAKLSAQVIKELW